MTRRFRQFGTHTLCLLAIAALSFCLNSARADGPIIVRYWHTMSDRETAKLTEHIGEFEAAHPGIQVEATRYAYIDFRNALLRSIVAGTFPDVARLDSLWVPEFADLGVLTPLDTAMPDFSEVASRFFDGPLQTGYWRGQHWALPLDTNTQVLLYNPAQLEAAGLSVPQTVDAFVNAACALTDGKGRFGYALDGTYFWSVAPLFYAQGGQLTDDAGTTASGYLDSPASVRAFQTLVNLYDNGCLAPNLLGGGVDSAEGHATGLYSMTTDSPPVVELYKDRYPGFQPNFALIPAGANGTASVVGGDDVVLFADSTRQDAALAWMRSLAAEDYQLALAQVGLLPTLKSLSGNPALPAYFDVFMRQLETARARTPVIHSVEIDNVLNNAFVAMLRHRQTVEAALTDAAAEINDLLAN